MAERLINDDKHVLAFYCFSPVTLRPLGKVELKLKSSLISIVLTKLHLLNEREGRPSSSRSTKEIDLWWRCTVRSSFVIARVILFAFFFLPPDRSPIRPSLFAVAAAGARRSLDRVETQLNNLLKR